MPRTAPTVNGTPQAVRVSFRYIDANGTKDAFSIITTLARATNANVEACLAKLGAASNVNFYEADIGSLYRALPSPGAAVEEPRESAKDVLEILEKDLSSAASQYVYIPGPLDSLFLEGTNDPDITQTAFTEVRDAFSALLPATYAAASVRFAEHKNQGQRQEM